MARLLGVSALMAFLFVSRVEGFLSFQRYFSFVRLFDTKVEPKSDRYVHSDESRAKISAANRGKTPWNIGRKHDEETKRKIAERTREAMLRKKLEKAKALGLTLEEYDSRKDSVRKEKRKMQLKGGLTEEGRRRISEAMRKRWRDPDSRASYLSKASGSRNHTDETRARISEAIRKKWQDGVYSSKVNVSLTDEQRARRSLKMKSLWEDPEYRERMRISRGKRGDDWKAKISLSIKTLWENETYRSSVLTSLRASNHTARRVPTVRLSDDERHRRREQARAERASRRNAKRKALKNAKKAQADMSDQHSLKDILGKEIWFEEKVFYDATYATII